MPLGMLGKYERLDVLGHGVSGIVYLAKDTLLNKQVALKEVDVQAGDMRRFLEEARVMDRLRHPNIVRVNGVDRIDGKVVIDMEYVRGDNLQDLLRRDGRLPVDRALDIAAQTLDALDYAHRMQTVHRDIKPANILISRDGEVKLVDFGLAEILATNAYAGGAGTYAYMAPEDFAEEDRSDSQSDIWAVGVTLYEMLTAQRPFQVTKVKDPFAWKRVLESELPTPLAETLPGAPPELQAVLDRALARSKRDRYQTAGEFRDDVLRLRADPAILHRPADESDRTVALPVMPGLEKDRNGHKPNDEERPPVSRGDTGVVVADVKPAAIDNPTVASPRREMPAESRQRRGFLKRKPVEVRLVVEPGEIDFGEVRKGDLRMARLHTRVIGSEDRIVGRIIHTPGWLTASPTSFDNPRQIITLTARSERAWETGDFQETVRVETTAGNAEIPVRLRVLKPRPTFINIAAWYVPLFGCALLPILSVAFGGHVRFGTAEFMTVVPSAAAATGLLSAMLLLICIAADVGVAERIACGVISAVMCVLLGAYIGQSQGTALHAAEMQRITLTSGLVGAALALQLLYLSKWKLWAITLAGLGLLIGGTFLQFMR